MLLSTWESQGSLTKEVITKRFRRIKRELPNSGEGGRAWEGPCSGKSSMNKHTDLTSKLHVAVRAEEESGRGRGT